jgi:hypothetical protein
MKKQLFSFLLLLLLFSSVSAQDKEARLVDEFGRIQCEDLRMRLDNFLVNLQNSPQSRGHIIVYDGKHSFYDYRKKDPKLEYRLPIFGEATLLTQQMLTHFKFRKFPPEKYLFITGGFRENYTVEFWIVPKGVKPPTPSPTLDEIKYRKGKLVGVICEEG